MTEIPMIMISEKDIALIKEDYSILLDNYKAMLADISKLKIKQITLAQKDQCISTIENAIIESITTMENHIEYLGDHKK